MHQMLFVLKLGEKIFQFEKQKTLVVFSVVVGVGDGGKEGPPCIVQWRLSLSVTRSPAGVMVLVSD